MQELNRGDQLFSHPSPPEADQKIIGMQPAIKYITIGKVLKGKGVERSLKVLPLTFDPSRFLALREVYFQKDDSLMKSEIDEVEVLRDHVLLKIRGLDSAEKTLTLQGCEVKIPETESPPLPEGIYYHYEIIGLDVYTDGGTYLGKVHQIIETGSNDVYSVLKDGKEVLIPAIEEIVLEIDIVKRLIVIHPMKGLLDDV